MPFLYLQNKFFSPPPQVISNFHFLKKAEAFKKYDSLLFWWLGLFYSAQCQFCSHVVPFHFLAAVFWTNAVVVYVGQFAKGIGVSETVAAFIDVKNQY